MREIKFRSWDKLAKKMSNSYNLQRQPTFNSEHNGKFCISTISPSGWLGFDGFSENERQIAMQYTGLKDKNGIEIYEYMELDNQFEVSFSHGSYILTNISNGDIMTLHKYIKDKNGQVKITKEYTKI